MSHSCSNTYNTHSGFVGFNPLWFSFLSLWFFFFSFEPFYQHSALSPLSEQVKNKDPPKIATKVTPPFNHLSLYSSPQFPPSTPTPSNPALHLAAGWEYLSLYLSSFCFTLLGFPSTCCIKGEVLSPCFNCQRVQLSTSTQADSLCLQSQFPASPAFTVRWSWMKNIQVEYV